MNDKMSEIKIADVIKHKIVFTFLSSYVLAKLLYNLEMNFFGIKMKRLNEQK